MTWRKGRKVLIRAKKLMHILWSDKKRYFSCRLQGNSMNCNENELTYGKYGKGRVVKKTIYPSVLSSQFEEKPFLKRIMKFLFLKKLSCFNEDLKTLSFQGAFFKSCKWCTSNVGCVTTPYLPWYHCKSSYVVNRK